MIIEIEYYMGDVMLMGKARGSAVLRRQLADIERRYDRDTGKLRKLHKSTDK